MQRAQAIRRNGWFVRANPISQADNLPIAVFRSGARWRKSSKRTSLIVWTTLGLPTTLNALFVWLHFLAAWTIAPSPQESMKSILDKSNLKILSASDLNDAAKKISEAIK